MSIRVTLDQMKRANREKRVSNGIVKVIARAQSEIPNFVVPNTGMSVDTFAGIIRDILHIDRRKILSGEITIREKKLLLRLRLNAWDLDLDEVHFDDPERLDALFRLGAEKVFEKVYPLIFALDVLSAGPWKTLDIVNSFIYPKKRDNVFGSLFGRICRTATRFRFFDFTPKCHNPDSSIESAHLLRAYALWIQNKQEDALNELRKDINNYPEDTNYYYLASIMLDSQSKSENSNWKQAVKYLDEAIHRDPDEPLFYEQMCQSQWLLGEKVKAIDACGKALDLARTLAKDKNDAEAQRDLAVSLERVGEIMMLNKTEDALSYDEEALAIAEQLAMLDEGSEDAKNDLVAEAAGRLAFHRLLAKRFKKSLEASERAIAAAPGLVWLHMNRAHALMFLDQVKDARTLYLAHRGEKTLGDKIWEDVIHDDFTALRNAGLTNPLMDEIERTFAQEL